MDNIQLLEEHEENMTDNEIIKALELCTTDDCNGCPYRCEDCLYMLAKDSLELINRQKTEIEELQKRIVGWCQEKSMNTKEIFAKRVMELRKEKGLTQGQLAERVGVSKTSANLYESATRVPDIQVLVRYAKELEVTADYLLGLSDNRTAEAAAIGDKLGLSDETIEWLKYFIERIRK